MVFSKNNENLPTKRLGLTISMSENEAFICPLQILPPLEIGTTNCSSSDNAIKRKCRSYSSNFLQWQPKQSSKYGPITARKKAMHSEYASVPFVFIKTPQQLGHLSTS